MHSLNSDKEFINGNNAVFGEFIDPPIINNTNDIRNNNLPTMYYYYNTDLIQVFHNRNINSVNNNINLNESSDLILEISRDDLEHLAPVQQVKQVLSCSYENNPVLIIVATITFRSEEEDEVNILFWVDILSKTIKHISLDKPLVGIITSSDAMCTPMAVSAGATKQRKDNNVLRHVLALGMQDGSIRMIMLEYPVEKDVLKARSAIIEASELDGSPVTAVELYPPNSHQPTTLKRIAVCHDARLIVGTIDGLLAYYAVQSTVNIDVRNQYRLKRHTNYRRGAITGIKALRDSKKDTKCIMAVAQDSSRDIGRALTNDFDKQACVNIIEVYGNNIKSWIFAIEPNDLQEMCEITSMRLLPAPVGYSIMIVFRAINGSASETVCHTILSSEKGQLDLSKMSPGPDWILDAYPMGDSYLALKQKELVKTQSNTIKILPSSEEKFVPIKTKEDIIDITTKVTINKTVYHEKDDLNQYTEETLVKTDSQTTLEPDSASTNINGQEDKSYEVQEISSATNDVNDIAVEIYSEAKAALDTLSHDSQDDAIMEMDTEADIAANVYSEAKAALNTLSHDSQDDAIMEMDADADRVLDTLSPDIKKEDEKDGTHVKENHYNTPPPSKETESNDYKETKVAYHPTEEESIVNNTVESSTLSRDEGDELLQYEEDVQETPETIIYPDDNIESIIDKPIASDTSVSSEDETYASTAEKSKEASPDTSGSDEPEQKDTQIPKATIEEHEDDDDDDDDDEEEEVSIIERSKDEMKEDGEIIEEEEEKEAQGQQQKQRDFDDLEPSADEFNVLASTILQKLPYPFSFNSTLPINDSNTAPVNEQLNSHYHDNHLYYHQDEYQNQSQNIATSDTPITIPTLANTPDNNDNHCNTNNWSSFVDTETTATSVTSPSPSTLKTHDSPPSPLQLCNNDTDTHPPSPYEYIPMSPIEDSQIQYREEEDTDIYSPSSTSILQRTETETTTSITTMDKTLAHVSSQQPSLNREMAVDQELFIDVMLKELYPNYDKNYPRLNGELELILARPVNNNQSHSHAKYYKRLRDTGDDIVNSSIIDISVADQNLVIVCWLLDRCQYKRALMYLQKNCNTTPYAYKIIKTLEKGFGVEKAWEYINELEATKTEGDILVDPKARVQILQEGSFSNALTYINKNEKIADIRNDLMKFVCDKLFQGPIIPSVHDIRELGIYNYADEQRQWLLTFAKNNDSIASKTLLIYLYLIKEERGEGVLLNRALQKNKPKAGLSVEEQTLYQRCQELEDKVYDLEPTLSRDLPPEIYLFPPGQARPPYQNFFEEHGVNASHLLLEPIFMKRLEEVNKRKREKDDNDTDNHHVENYTKYRKL